MIEADTVRLLRECDAGTNMGIASIDDVLGCVKADRLRSLLSECRREHEQLSAEIRDRLDRFGDEGKSPNPVARKMSWLKSNVKLVMHESDRTVADLMTDGCNMGVKSLNRYLNEYKAADENAKDIAKRLIHLEQDLAHNVSGFL